MSSASVALPRTTRPAILRTLKNRNSAFQMTSKAEWLQRAIRQVRALRDEAPSHGLGQFAYLLEGAAREAEAHLPSEAPARIPNAYSAKTLAERWQCSPNHVRSLIAKGSLEALPMSDKLLRISRQAVEAFESKPAFPSSDGGSR